MLRQLSTASEFEELRNASMPVRPFVDFVEPTPADRADIPGWDVTASDARTLTRPSLFWENWRPADADRRRIPLRPASPPTSTSTRRPSPTRSATTSSRSRSSPRTTRWRRCPLTNGATSATGSACWRSAPTTSNGSSRCSTRCGRATTPPGKSPRMDWLASVRSSDRRVHASVARWARPTAHPTARCTRRGVLEESPGKPTALEDRRDLSVDRWTMPSASGWRRTPRARRGEQRPTVGGSPSSTSSTSSDTTHRSCRCVLRCEGGGCFSGTDLAREGSRRLHHALDATPVPTPHVLTLAPNGAAMLMERLPGSAELPPLRTDARTATMRSFTDALAALHALDVESLALPGFPAAPHRGGPRSARSRAVGPPRVQRRTRPRPADPVHRGRGSGRMLRRRSRAPCSSRATPGPGTSSPTTGW